MSDAFTILILGALTFLLFILAYGSGVLDSYVSWYKKSKDDFNKRLMASDVRSEVTDPDRLLHDSWGREGKKYDENPNGH